MKTTITILALILISAIGFAQTDSIRGNRVELEGRLINEISMTPNCGYIAWATVIEVEIKKCSNSKYELDSVGVIVTCPEFYDNGFFKAGKTYTLEVSDENQADFGWTIPNDSILDKYNLDKRLWVIRAEIKE
nr:hypothetical protein [uncultured Carboxylicivirga sp.]